MHFGGPFFVITIVALSLTAWLVNNWIRARHGFSVSDDWGREIAPPQARAAQLMAQENAQLKASIGRLEERIAVLERIATDAPNRLSAEIERLRG
jgi:cell division protein FtsB